MRTNPEVILTTVSQDGFKRQGRGVDHQDLVETFFLSVHGCSLQGTCVPKDSWALTVHSQA